MISLIRSWYRFLASPRGALLTEPVAKPRHQHLGPEQDRVEAAIIDHIHRNPSEWHLVALPRGGVAASCRTLGFGVSYEPTLGVGRATIGDLDLSARFTEQWGKLVSEMIARRSREEAEQKARAALTFVDSRFR